MILLMPKTTSINLRISPDFRDEIERLADYHGLTMSSYAHSLLVKAVRREREVTPEAFRATRQRGTPIAPRSGSRIPLRPAVALEKKRKAR